MFPFTFEVNILAFCLGMHTCKKQTLEIFGLQKYMYTTLGFTFLPFFCHCFFVFFSLSFFCGFVALLENFSPEH